MRKMIVVLALVAAANLALARRARGQTPKNATARAQAAALFAKALAASDIRAPGSPPFELHGTINIGGHRKISGTYLLEWVSPMKWREEIRFENYTRIRVGGDKQYWQSRTTPYEVEPMLQLNQGLEFLKALHAWSNPEAIAVLKDVKFQREKMEGIKVDCVMLIPKGKSFGPQYCFDPATGAEVSDAPGPNHFSGFISFDGKYFPGSIRSEEASAPPVTLVVRSISPLGETGAEDFRPPQNSMAWPSCEDPDALPVMKHWVAADTSVGGHAPHGEGTVLLYGLIGVDGRFTNLTVLSTPDDSLAHSVMTAVRQREYEPETCHGIPVPAETLIDVSFVSASDP
jgi:hypothetical protein